MTNGPQPTYLQRPGAAFILGGLQPDFIRGGLQFVEPGAHAAHGRLKQVNFFADAPEAFHRLINGLWSDLQIVDQRLQGKNEGAEEVLRETFDQKVVRIPSVEERAALSEFLREAETRLTLSGEPLWEMSRLPTTPPLFECRSIDFPYRLEFMMREATLHVDAEYNEWLGKKFSPSLSMVQGADGCFATERMRFHWKIDRTHPIFRQNKARNNLSERLTHYLSESGQYEQNELGSKQISPLKINIAIAPVVGLLTITMHRPPERKDPAFGLVPKLHWILKAQTIEDFPREITG